MLHKCRLPMPDFDKVISNQTSINIQFDTFRNFKCTNNLIQISNLLQFKEGSNKVFDGICQKIINGKKVFIDDKS